MKYNTIVSSIIILFLLGINVNALGVSTVNSVTIPLQVYPGQTTTTDMYISNEEAQEVTVKGTVIEGAEIASIVNPKDTYVISPMNGDINKNRYNVQLKVQIPSNAEVGKEYTIKVNFEQVNVAGNGMITMGAGITRIIPVKVIPKEVVATPVQVTTSNTQQKFPVAIVLIVLVIVGVVAYFVWKNKKKVPPPVPPQTPVQETPK